MKTAGLVTLLAVVAAAVGSARGDEPPGAAAKLPAEAVAARREFDAAMKRADDARDAQVREARSALVKRLEAAVKAETRKGNLDRAIAVREALKESADAIAGTWLVTWDGSHTWPYEFGRDTANLVLGADLQRSPAHKVVRRGDTMTLWVVFEGKNFVHRYRPVGPYLCGEGWDDAAAFERGEPPRTVGAGRRSTADFSAPAAPVDAGKLPQDAVAARREFVKAAERADAERDKAVQAARAALAKRLEAAVKAETRKGNLDGAVATRAVLKTAAEPFAGVWAVSWSTDGTFRYDFGDNGAVVKHEAFTSTKVERAGATRVYRIAGHGVNHVHRYRRAGAYLVAEFWEDPAAFERGDMPTGVGPGVRAN